MTTAIIPAAGLGSRLGAEKPKALVELDGKTLLWYVVQAVTQVADAVVLVVTPGSERMFIEEIERSGWTGPTATRVQSHPNGSADAVGIGLDGLPDQEPCVVIWGDQVGVSAVTVARVVDVLLQGEPGLVLPLIDVSTPYVWYDVDDARIKVGRRRDGDEPPARGLTDVGTFGFHVGGLRPVLDSSPNDANGARERDFVYVVPRMAAHCGLQIIHVDDPAETLAVNDVDDLARAQLYFEGLRR